MQAPDKFWFYHKSDSSEIFFARKMGNDYFISDPKKETFVRFDHEVEEYFSFGHWVLTVPDKFCARGSLTGKVYSVIKDGNGLYVLKNQETGKVFFHRHEDVLECLYSESPLWEPIEESENQEHTTQKQQITEEPAEAPRKRMIAMNVNDVRAAAEFDVANNPHTKAKGTPVKEVEQEITDYLGKMYHNLMSGKVTWELHYTGTRTYRILFQPDDEYYGTITVLSDTSVGMPMFYASVEDFLNQN